MAGLPWVFILQGELMSLLFALLALLRAKQLWHSSEQRSLSVPFATAAALSTIALGHPASSTWPDHCFDLVLTNGKPALDWLLLAILMGLSGLACWSLVERELRRRLRRLRGLSSHQPEAAAKLVSFWIGLAGVAWSLENETLWPNLVKMVVGSMDGGASGYPTASYREPCNPEVGWVGAAFYALALVMLASGPARERSSAKLSPPRLRSLATGEGVLLVLLLLAQSGRTYVLLRRELPELKEHGGSLDCECKRWNDTVHL